MSVPASCEAGLFYSEIMPFDLGYFDIDTGDFEIVSSILKYKGPNTDVAANLVKWALPFNNFVVTCAFTFKSNFGYNVNPLIAFEGRFGLVAYNAGNEPANGNTAANGGFAKSNGFEGRVAVINQSGGGNTHSADVLDPGTTYSGTTTLTVGAINGNGNRDLVINVQVPSVSINISRTFTDFVSPGNLIAFCIDGAVTVPGDGGLFNISSIEIVGHGLPIACPGSAMPPVPLSPADNATGVGLMPTLTVTDVNDPPSDSFDFELSNDGSFSGGDIIYSVSEVANSPVVPFGTLLFSTEYFWRARAHVDDQVSDWSSIVSFTTASVGSSVPEITSPAQNQSNVSALPLVTYTAVTAFTPDSYEIQISATPDFLNPLIDGSSTDLEYQVVTELENHQIYYARVRAILDDEEFGWSEVVRFSVLTETLEVPTSETEIMMRYSTDRGKTWSDEDWQQTGGTSSYVGRNRWVGLGAGYGICFWFRTVSDKYVSWRSVRVRAQ